LVDPVTYSPVIYDDGSTAIGTRTMIMSVNTYDFQSTTLSQLKGKLGASVVNNLIVQAAMNTDNQQNAIQDAIRQV
jgi:hypothetical protein